jgi:predicted Rossmann fold flavoprotein
MSEYSIAVVGGGAAGICAAISAANRGKSVVLCEKMPHLGKKILATGNGRCNLSNDKLDQTFYNFSARGLVKSVFDSFGRIEILDFFKGLGLLLYSDSGRIFPATNQAASVLKVLEMELQRLRVPIELSFECTDVSFSTNDFVVTSRGRKTINCQKVIIAGGGKTYPSFGSNGSLHEILKSLGHTVVEPVPCAVPLLVKDSLCQMVQGQRIAVQAWSMIDGHEGKAVRGELLFAKYGLSGTCILDISEAISIALNRERKSEVYVCIDMVPSLDKEELKSELGKRRAEGRSSEDMLVGILPNKLSVALRALFENHDSESAAEYLKNRRFRVNGTRGWNEAEFTAGGVDIKDIDWRTLESKICHNLYLAGEILDVNGERGGYNLAWAWASGFVAGQTK